MFTGVDIVGFEFFVHPGEYVIIDRIGFESIVRHSAQPREG